MEALFDMPEIEQTSLTKGGFAQKIGVVPGRVTQLIAKGLPLEPNGQINVKAGLEWLDKNLDPARRRAKGTDEAVRPHDYRMERDKADARMATLKADKMAGSLIDRRAAIDAIEARARMERDAWLSWVNRISPEVSRESGLPIDQVTALLDRLVRDQLNNLATLQIPELKNDR